MPHTSALKHSYQRPPTDGTLFVPVFDSLSLALSAAGTEEPGAVLCLYKTDNDCVMKFTYSEHASGQSILTALKEPGQSRTTTTN